MRDFVRRASAVLGVVALLAGAGADAWAGPATDQLRPSMDQVLRLLDDPRLKTPGAKTERRAALRQVIDRVIDFPDAARRALGPYWRERSEAERAEFVALFRDLVTSSYLVQIEAHEGERIVYLAETVDDGIATVRTKIESARRPDLPVDYRMHQVGACWLVYDVMVEGVSLVGNYRSQFNSIIQTSSYGELVRRIKRRLIELEAPAGAASS